jgi:hypothetical protein
MQPPCFKLGWAFAHRHGLSWADALVPASGPIGAGETHRRLSVPAVVARNHSKGVIRTGTAGRRVRQWSKTHRPSIRVP